MACSTFHGPTSITYILHWFHGAQTSALHCLHKKDPLYICPKLNQIMMNFDNFKCMTQVNIWLLNACIISQITSLLFTLPCNYLWKRNDTLRLTSLLWCVLNTTINRNDAMRSGLKTFICWKLLSENFCINVAALHPFKGWRFFYWELHHLYWKSFLQGVSIALLCKQSYASPVVLAMIGKPSVCLSVHPSHAVTEWKRCKLGSGNLHQRIAQL